MSLTRAQHRALSYPRYIPLGELLVWNCRFSFQSRQTPINGLKAIPSAAILRALQTDEGDVELIGAGTYRAKTTVEKAGKWLVDDEVILFPRGGNAYGVKYFKGRFCTANCYIGKVARPDIIHTPFLALWLEENAPRIDYLFHGAAIRQPDMKSILALPVPVPDIEYQRQAAGFLLKLKYNLDNLISAHNLRRLRLKQFTDGCLSKIIQK